LKILPYGDWHLDVASGDINIPESAVSEADIIISTGDISSNPRESIRTLAEIFYDKTVICVPGEIEMCDGDLVMNMIDMQAEAYKYDNIHMLNDSHVVIDGILFYGGVMWPNFEVDGKIDYSKEEVIEKTIADLRKTKYQGKPLDGKILREFNRRYTHGLRQACNRHRGTKVALSHFCPAVELTKPKYSNSILNLFYNCDMSLYHRYVGYWFFGHTHGVWDKYIKDTRFISNPLGFTKSDGSYEDPEYNPKKIIEIH